MKHQMMAPHGNDTLHVLARRSSSSVASSAAASASTSALPVYKLICTDFDINWKQNGKDLEHRGYKDVCENWCYYVFCKKGGRDANDRNWIVTVDRKANNRKNTECGKKPNKCNSSDKSKDWPLNPVSGLTCDEQPKNTQREGGHGAATRCINKEENRHEGRYWQAVIDKKDAKIKDGSKVKVVLESPPPGGFCASLHNPGTTVCVAPVTPRDPAVLAGTENGSRQQ